MNRQTSGKSAAGRQPTKSVRRSVVNLSPEKVETLSARDVRRLLLRLVKVLHEREARRPTWWPRILPWTQQRFATAVKTATTSVMRKLAKKICNFLTQHTSSKAASLAAPVPSFSQPRVLDWVNSHPPSRLSAQPLKSGEKSSPKKSDDVPYLDIYLCYQCNEEFSTKDTLQKHQVQCQRGTLPLSIPSTPPVSEAPSPAPPACTPEDPGSVSMASGTTSSSGCSSLAQSQFVAGLDLVPLHRARKIRQARRRNTECETIDLEEPQTPVSPSTPRSHKFLITQLSRDVSNNSLGVSGNSGCLGSRQSSCLRQSLDKRPDSNGKLNRDTSSTSLAGSGNSEELGGRRSSLLRLSLDNRPENVGNEAEQPAESDGESSESSAEDTDEPKLRKKTLFSIDVSSVLGQRIIKHMTSEVNVPVISNLEEFCRTPIKDKYQDRLRYRQTTYPVTWKLTRKRQQQYCHLYKFTRADKLEFKETLRSGLNLETRKLQESLNKCSVVVKRLSSKTLLKWTSVARMSLTKQLLTQAKASFSEASVFPEGPTFLLTDVDRVLGLKRKDGKPELARKLLASHCVSETANAELQSQKLTVYRCLLTDLYSSVTSDGGQCSGTVSTLGPSPEGSLRNKQKYPALLSLLSGNESKSPFQSKADGDAPVDVEKPLKIEIPSSTGMLQPLDKSSSMDDSFSVKTLSSDEEMDRSTTCCPLCDVRNRCKCPSKKALAVCSPALASQVSSLSKASVSPPQLDPLSLTPRVSSLHSLSPPDLSPVSQLGEACPQSSLLRKSTRWSLLKTSSSPKLTSTPCAAAAAGSSGTNLFQCPSAPSPGQMSSGRRGDRVTARPADACPSPAKRTHSSPVLSASSSLLQPLLVTQTLRPLTRSSAKQNVADESSGSASQQKPCLTRWDCRCGGTGCVAGHSLMPTSSVTVAEALKRLASASIESPLMPSPVYTDDKNKMNSLCNPASDRKKSVSCSSTDNADSTASKERRKAETVERVEKKTVDGKVQTRSTLQESSRDRSKRTKQREDTADSKKLRNGKSCDAGDSTAKAPQKMDLMKKTQAESNGSKGQIKKEAQEAQKMKAAGEKENTTDDVEGGDRDATGGSRALRNRERKYSREVNKETPDCVSTHTKTVPVMNVNGSKVACQVPDQHCQDVGEMPSAVAKKIEAVKEERVSIRKLRSDIAGSGLYESEANGKELGTSAIQMRTPVLRKPSSKKGIAATAQTDTSVQRDSTENAGRITRGSSLSSVSGTKLSQHVASTENPGRTTRGSSLSSTNGTEISWTKASEQKTDTVVGAAETKGVKRKSLTTSEGVNPFLAIRAETRLFSSRIKEHTHRAWKLAQSSPTGKGGSRGLKSGNTFRLGSVSLASPANSFESRPQVIGHSDNSSSFLLNKQPATESSGTKPPRSDAGLTQGGPVSPTRLSPKQMLSVLESAKGTNAFFKEKYRKESARGHTSSHGSFAKFGVRAGSLTQHTGSLGSYEQSVSSQLPSAAKNISSRTPFKSMEEKSQKSQGSPSKTMVSQKSPLKSSKLTLQAKNGSSSSEGVTLKSASSQKWSQFAVARTTGKRSTSSTASGESGSPCKKMCV